MISADSLVTIVRFCLSHSTGTVTRPECRVCLGIDLMQEALAVDRIGARRQFPAVLQHQRLDHRDGDRVLQLLQLAEDQGAVRPWAGQRDIEVVAPRLGLEARRTVGGDPVPERALLPLERAAGRFRVVPLVVPASVDQQTHGRRPFLLVISMTRPNQGRAMEFQHQPCSFAAISATWRPWKRAPSSSLALGWREPSPAASVVAP